MSKIGEADLNAWKTLAVDITEKREPFKKIQVTIVLRS